MKRFVVILTAVISGSALAVDHYVGKYADCNGTADNGESVTGECYFYSDRYGDFSGETENGDSASGECYRYSRQYADLESVTTDDGDSVYGGCYIYGL